MYVFVLDSLKPAHQACQGGHAVAQYLLRRKTGWDNGNMIYLQATETQLEQVAEMPESVPWREEDFDDQLTAVAHVTDNKKLFQKFKLL